MDLDIFLKLFLEQFEETPQDQIKQNTIFRDLDEWDSMIALTIIAMVDENYGVKISGEDIRTSNTIGDIFDKVSAKVS